MTTAAPSFLSYRLVRAELERRGYTTEHFSIGRQYTRFVAPNGRGWFTRNALLSYPFVAGSTESLCSNKEISQAFALSQGISSLTSLVYPCGDLELKEFLKDNAPLAVKPLDSSGSRGLTLGVTNEKDLRDALDNALLFSDKVLVQRQFMGEDVRITVSDGKVVSALLRQTPRVIGDGASTVSELIAAENKAREKLNFEYLPYPQLTAETIPEALFTDTRVPREGELVELSKSIMVRTGASLYDIAKTLHSSYTEAAVKLANLLNPSFLVIDFMIQDYRQPLANDNYVFLEFTCSPALKMHYAMRDGNHFDAIKMMADKIDDYCGVVR